VADIWNCWLFSMLKDADSLTPEQALKRTARVLPAFEKVDAGGGFYKSERRTHLMAQGLSLLAERAGPAAKTAEEKNLVAAIQKAAGDCNTMIKELVESAKVADPLDP